MNIKRIQELFNYNPQKGKLNEGWNDVDTSNYICIGEVPYDPWLDGTKQLYIMVSPQKIMKHGREEYDVRYTKIVMVVAVR